MFTNFLGQVPRKKAKSEPDLDTPAEKPSASSSFKKTAMHEARWNFVPQALFR